MIPITNEKDFWTEATYLVTVDLNQKRKKEIATEGGDKVKLTILTEFISNHRLKHPNYAKIVSTSGKAQFKAGEGLICNHFAFEDVENNSKHIYEKDRVKYYRVTNFDVMFGVVNGELIPREGVLLCEGVEDKLVNTNLHMTGDYVGKRRDIAKVIKTWEGCTNYEVGDYVLLEKGGDYLFEHNGKEYTKVDTYNADVLAIVDTPEVRIDEIRIHVKTHDDLVQI
jgi:hypothetical protein